jgi:DNA-binding NarL/FixJ family response regulator
VRLVRRPNGHDACIYSTIPSSEPGRVLGLSLHRAWGEPQFTAAERDAVLMFHQGIEPLLVATWDGDDSLAGVVKRLPLRLQRVLFGLLKGESEKQIAGRLGLSGHTVHQYVKDLHALLGVTSRGELLSKCLGDGVSALLVVPRNEWAEGEQAGK